MIDNKITAPVNGHVAEDGMELGSLAEFNIIEQQGLEGRCSIPFAKITATQERSNRLYLTQDAGLQGKILTTTSRYTGSCNKWYNRKDNQICPPPFPFKLK